MATYFYTKVTKIAINNSDQLSNGTIKTGYSFTDEGNLLILFSPCRIISLRRIKDLNLNSKTAG